MYFLEALKLFFSWIPGIKLQQKATVSLAPSLSNSFLLDSGLLYNPPLCLSASISFLSVANLNYYAKNSAS